MGGNVKTDVVPVREVFGTVVASARDGEVRFAVVADAPRLQREETRRDEVPFGVGRRVLVPKAHDVRHDPHGADRQLRRGREGV